MTQNVKIWQKTKVKVPVYGYVIPSKNSHTLPNRWLRGLNWCAARTGGKIQIRCPIWTGGMKLFFCWVCCNLQQLQQVAIYSKVFQLAHSSSLCEHLCHTTSVKSRTQMQASTYTNYTHVGVHSLSQWLTWVFFALLQEQRVPQDLMQKLLLDSVAPVQASSPVYARDPVSAESYVWSYRAILIQNQYQWNNIEQNGVFW